MEGLTEGRIVHYVLPEGRHEGEHRPAIVVKVWRNVNGKAAENGCCQLQVFMDGSNDGMSAFDSTIWKTSVLHDAEDSPNTWHWIERG